MNDRWNPPFGKVDKSGGGASNKAQGTPVPDAFPVKQKDRSGGTPKKGWIGKFFNKSEGI